MIQNRSHDAPGYPPLTHDQDALAEGPIIAVNADLEERAVVETAAMSWSPSPWIPGINRKFLDRYGNGQFVPSTSVVSFESGVRDPYHAHPHGEEYFVLSGTFTDHTGDYLPGFYVRHPMRWCHAPYVDVRNQDAVVWVKVSQVAEEGEPIIVTDTCDPDLPAWQDRACLSGRIRALPLYASARTGERVWIELWEPGTEDAVLQPPGGEEVFVISGSLTDDGVVRPGLTWIRNPARGEGASWRRSTAVGCKLLMKSGHMAMVAELYDRAKDGSLFRSDVQQYRQDQRIHGDPHGQDIKRREREAAAFARLGSPDSARSQPSRSPPAAPSSSLATPSSPRANLTRVT